MRIYTAAGKGATEYTPRTFNDFLNASGFDMLLGKVKSVQITGKKILEPKGTALDGIIDIPCANKTVPIHITSLLTNEAHKNYEPFLDEMECTKLVGLYMPEYIKGKEIGVVVDVHGDPAGFVPIKGLRELAEGGYIRH